MRKIRGVKLVHSRPVVYVYKYKCTFLIFLYHKLDMLDICNPPCIYENFFLILSLGNQCRYMYERTCNCMRHAIFEVIIKCTCRKSANADLDSHTARLSIHTVGFVYVPVIRYSNDMYMYVTVTVAGKWSSLVLCLCALLSLISGQSHQL